MRDVREKELMNVLAMMSPGTPFRDGLENVLKAKTGGLIVVGDQEEIMKIVDGGFYINSEYTPSYLYELAKMDGAIILSSDLKRILYANTQLIPDSSIPTSETGTRHRTADRVAKQTGILVVAISQRRNVITVYKGNLKYVLKDTNIILTKANQAIQTLERYKVVLDEAMANVSALEFEDLVTVYDVATAVQRNEMVMRIVYEIERYICELGNEGRLVSMQLDDLADGVEQDGILLIRDYVISQKDYEDVVKSIRNLSSEELLELPVICKALGYSPDQMLDTMISSRGYRILSKIPRVPSIVIDNMVKTFGQLKNVLRASIEDLDAVEGIGEARARAIKDGLRKIQEQALLNRHI
ncbi:DNA integrity scanning protein DisA [Fervidicella metallireducens AeB]|uniref:DNA integrity scanning protein DisA n=1 Tax=Fervidicella metallireducens AeB TaxID=1403537 RepID=A0A017RYC2_9CLOT|nr:DNA integrity scanning diadenylate cyclase DisA [Fervidicella metallireducens]EYE88940.1 DNA integrity scanning protein DisA [Fervidicella metallireducens AeB]